MYNWNNLYRIEQTKGQYNLNLFNSYVNGLNDRGMQFFGILDYSNNHYDDNLSPYTQDGNFLFLLLFLLYDFYL